MFSFKGKVTMVFLGKALNTIAYVMNLSHGISLKGDVSNRVWFGKDVSYDLLSVFSHKTILHVQKNERLKLDSKTCQCIFLGYGQDEFRY